MKAFFWGRVETDDVADKVPGRRRMKTAVAAMMLCLTLLAMADPGEGERDFSDQLLRLAQYEAILDLPLDGQTGICMDGVLGAQWRMPDFSGAAADVPANISSPVSQAHDNCLAASQSDDLRVVEALRAALGNQRRAALADERLSQARQCLRQQASDANASNRRQCLQEASGEALSAMQWKRWSVLFQFGQARK